MFNSLLFSSFQLLLKKFIGLQKMINGAAIYALLLIHSLRLVFIDFD